jgi:hypothetical protein
MIKTESKMKQAREKASAKPAAKVVAKKKG